MDHRRRARHDGLGERFIRDLQVGLILQRRHPQRVAVVAEAVLRSAVFRKPGSEFDRPGRAGLASFARTRGGSSGGSAWPGFSRSAARRRSCVEPGRHQLAVFFLEGRFLRGRHVAEIEPIEHVAPVVAIVALDEIGIELVDPQLPLGLGSAP